MSQESNIISDNEKVRETMELFLVHYFNTIEMAGLVKSEKTEDINYFSINLKEVEWEKDIEKLNNALFKYLGEWAQKNFENFDNYVAISKITVEYLLPSDDQTNQDVSKHLKLFHLPRYYYQNSNSNNLKTYSPFVFKILKIWYNPILRNIILLAIPTIVFITLSAWKIYSDPSFENRIIKAYEYVNVASGIMASLVLGYLITKVISLRQEKLRYTREIRDLSNKLTYFRNICFNLVRDHKFWHRESPEYKSYSYAESIKNDISFEEYYYPNYDDKVKRAKFKSFYNEDVYHSVVVLVLQLHMMADEEFLNSQLTYTEYPSNYIYTFKQMERFSTFINTNQIWYSCAEINIFPKTFQSSYHSRKIVEDINRIFPEQSEEYLTSSLLEKVSMEFQYSIIPQLFKLTRAVESGLPYTIKYFSLVFSLIIVFGLLVPTLLFILLGLTYSMLSLYVVIGIISHVLLSLKAVLKAENRLSRKHDFL